MSYLARLFRRGRSVGEAVAPTRSPDPVHWLTSTEHVETWTITPIDNGFLLSRRRYNPQGPDKIAAHYAANPAALAELVTSQMTLLRLNK